MQSFSPIPLDLSHLKKSSSDMELLNITSVGTSSSACACMSVKDIHEVYGSHFRRSIIPGLGSTVDDILSKEDYLSVSSNTGGRWVDKCINLQVMAILKLYHNVRPQLIHIAEYSLYTLCWYCWHWLLIATLKFLAYRFQNLSSLCPDISDVKGWHTNSKTGPSYRDEATLHILTMVKYTSYLPSQAR